MKRVSKRTVVLGVTLLAVAFVALLYAPAAFARRGIATVVMVPEEDRFVPFATVVAAGSAVRWVNNDEDDHTIVSDDFFNTTKQNRGVNALLPGTDSNGGNPGTLTLNFGRPGVFVYYCRFHAHLDDQHQPAAPGPEGGIDGVPMSGVVVVLPGNS
jgi:plastocyanin